jgi:hypothetical protein
MEPGMANTSRPCSDAMRAVSDPDAGAASTTRVPWDRPEMMRLRLGVGRQGRRSQRVFTQQQPCCAILCASSRFFRG